MANANGWGDGASNNDIGWGQGADNAISWGSVYSVSSAGLTDIIGTPAVDPDAQAFITAASITDPTQQSAINQLVVDLKGYNIWTKMKALYPFVGGTATTHKFNLKDPRDLDAAFRLVFNGGWTHTANGATPNGTNGYANTYYVPNESSAAIGTYIRTNNAAANKSDMGAFQGGNTNVAAKWSDNNAYAFITAATGFGWSNANTQGFYFANRVSSVLLNSWKNGVKQGTSTSTWQAVSSPITLYIGGYNANGVLQYPSDRQTAFGFISQGLSDTEAANFYTAVQAFQTTLGRQV